MSKSIIILAHAVALSLIAIVCHGMVSFVNVTDAMAFYGVYHRDPINQLLHFFGVPCIVWSLLVFLCHLPLPVLNFVMVNVPFAPQHELNYATVITIGYVIYYFKLDFFGGSLYAPFAYFLYVTAVTATVNDQKMAREGMFKKEDNNDKEKLFEVSRTGTGKLFRNALYVHLLGWYVQIHPGHLIFEGAKPALAESIGGAITSGPLFAYYEGLWYVGLNKKLQAETLRSVDIQTKELCANGAQMRICQEYE